MENIQIVTGGLVDRQLEGDMIIPFDDPQEARRRLIGRGYTCVSPPTRSGDRTVEVWSRRPQKGVR